MFEFHSDKQTYFRIQYDNAHAAVIPFIEQIVPLQKEMKVLEIGCAEGGVLKAFIDRGCMGVGVELSTSRAEAAKKNLEVSISSRQAEIFSKDIYDASFLSMFTNSFDLIILKDVIEHIHDQQRLIHLLKSYLKKGGKIFFGFPPWLMPFGGHQQICKSKFLGQLPYYHLLPVSLYRFILKTGGETSVTISDLLEIKQTGLSIQHFEKILRKENFIVDRKEFFLVNPIYQYKFGWKARRQNKRVAAIPFVRDFFTTAVYYLVSAAL